MLNVLDHFKSVLAHNQLAHAYIIDNINEKEGYSCFKELSTLLDILPQDCHYITTEKGSIGIDSIREITHRLSKSPIGNRHLVGINPAEKLNTASCNGLLKCLEEPPGNTCFVLLTQNARRLLPTIRSRSQLIRATTGNLKAYSNHPEYETLKALYQYNPTTIDSELSGLKLNHALEGNTFLSLAQLDIDPRLLIQLSMQLVSSRILEQSSTRLWQAYDQLAQLNQDYQKLQNLNEKGIIDRVGLILNQI